VPLGQRGDRLKSMSRLWRGAISSSRRAGRLAETRRRITEAPVELHRTVGLVELAAGA
jgi:hypothetical protein